MRVRVASLAFLCVLWASCTTSSGLPSPGSDAYRQLCSAFYLGLSALQSGEDVNARKGLTRATIIAPGEPASWADLGLLQFRQQDYDGAFASVGKAQALVPQNSRIEALLGVIESRRGLTTEALKHLQRAVALDGGNLKAIYGLEQETERQNSEASDAEAQKLLQHILAAQPNNLAVLVDLARLSAKRNDAKVLGQAAASLKRNEVAWPQAAQDQLAVLDKQAQGTAVRPAAVQAQFLRNILVRVPAYRQSLDEVKTPVTSAGEPFLRFLRLPSPSSDPSPPDMALTFRVRPVREIAGAPSWIGTFVRDEKSATELIWADERFVHLGSSTQLPLPGGAGSSALDQRAVLTADLNYDFRTDVVLASSSGLRIYFQQNGGSFDDVTAKTGLQPATVSRSYTGAWAFDFDLDGDLDLVLGVPQGEPVVLRNNGDGTFREVHPFVGIDGLRDFAAADVDGDGDPDVALLDKDGMLRVLANERLGDYRNRPVPAQVSGRCLRLLAADVDGDGLPDFVMLGADGHVRRLSDRSAGHQWSTGELATVKGASVGTRPPEMLLADLDNNGALDLVVGDELFLGDGAGFHHLGQSLPLLARTLIEAKSGRLNVIGLAADGRAEELANRGTKAYHWQDVRPKAASTTGDQRINSFGIGGEIEIRADLLTEKQIIESPLLHFGIGEHKEAEFARIVWPNGIIQTEFALKANQTLVAEQRLKGSCPLLYAWNGSSIKFVKDVAPMSAALGAHDGNGRFSEINQTEEWFKISGDQLKPHNGYYDLRVTDEYWEAYYIDRYSLRALDHPAGTQIFADERVAVPAAPLKIYTTGPSHVFASAHNEKGRDVRTLISKLDSVYLNTFSRGAYQGIAHDHWVELELPPDAPRDSPLYLIADGWLHPWDDGILVAANQGKQAKPVDLSIEVPDASGHWHTARDSLGVPAGREKTVVLELSKLFLPGAARKVRLRTNLEIYWDRLQWANAAPTDTIRNQQLALTDAHLHPRGFSQIIQRDPRSPEIPMYEQIAATGDQWNAIPGYYTRYGDVRPLLVSSDDRFVTVASGDELLMRFAEGRPCPPGWIRDYIFVGDGWMKEGDYSFRNSQSLLPLPYHARRTYNGIPSDWESDFAVRQHPSDWQIFHTRYVAETSTSPLKRVGDR